MDLRERLLDELARRRARNPRYSLRAFARQLGTDHSTISRVSAGRRLTVARMRALGSRLGLSASEIDGACRHENMLRVRDLVRRPGFRPDSRWIATRTGIALDDVNAALQALLAARRLHMTSTTTWTEELPMTPAVVRWQIVTPQAESAAGFYRSLFGWTVKQDNALGYREVQSAGGRGIDGGIWPAPAGTPTMAQLFIEVPDVDASIAAAVALGATVVVPKAVLPDGDTMAVLVDPTGLAFGLCALAAR